MNSNYIVYSPDGAPLSFVEASSPEEACLIALQDAAERVSQLYSSSAYRLCVLRSWKGSYAERIQK